MLSFRYFKIEVSDQFFYSIEFGFLFVDMTPPARHRRRSIRIGCFDLLMTLNTHIVQNNQIWSDSFFFGDASGLLAISNDLYSMAIQAVFFDCNCPRPKGMVASNTGNLKFHSML